MKLLTHVRRQHRLDRSRADHAVLAAPFQNVLIGGGPGSSRSAGGSSDDHESVDAYLFARWRADITGQKNPVWDDSFDMDCPECGAFAVEVRDGWKYVKRHSGK